VPLVLASNDVNVSDRYNWKDIAGVQYHYPNGYRNLILTGVEFVYYRGIRRANGARGPVSAVIEIASAPGADFRETGMYVPICLDGGTSQDTKLGVFAYLVPEQLADRI
jgi:hypothetical protein